MSLNDWIDIFKGGRQVDSQGTEHDGDALIAKAVANYNPEHHEAPAVVGHPQDDAPAYGWVEALRQFVRGGIIHLQAKLKQVDPAFAELVQQGRFKQRSAAFYPDGSLRHVAFLGAMPPAVKGLKAIAFNEDENQFNEFTQQTKESDMANGNNQPATEEMLAQERAKHEELSRQFAEYKATANREKLKNYLSGLEAKGIILPYQQPGLLNFMETLSQGTLSSQEQTTICFSEKDGQERKLSPLEFFQAHLEQQNKHGLFTESTRPPEQESKPAFGANLTSKV